MGGMSCSRSWEGGKVSCGVWMLNGERKGKEGGADGSVVFRGPVLLRGGCQYEVDLFTESDCGVGMREVILEF